MNRRNILATCLVAVAILSIASISEAAAVDLSAWNDEPTGNGNWVVDGSGDFVDQTINGHPTFFIGDLSATGQELNATAQVRTTSDDDFFGFVVGFTPGDSGSSSADYLLIDWKQGYQPDGGVIGLPGLAISRVTGVGTFHDFWAHQNAVTELARATNLGATGYVDWQEYAFKIVFTTTRVQVWVDGVKELDVNAATPFSDGRFGFYNESQAHVRYSAITQNVAPPMVPLPAAAWLGLIGLAGMAAVRKIRRRKK